MLHQMITLRRAIFLTALLQWGCARHEEHGQDDHRRAGPQVTRLRGKEQQEQQAGERFRALAAVTDSTVVLEASKSFDTALDLLDSMPESSGTGVSQMCALIELPLPFSEKRRRLNDFAQSSTSLWEIEHCLTTLAATCSATPNEASIAYRDLGYTYLRFDCFHQATGAFQHIIQMQTATRAQYPEMLYRAHLGLAASFLTARQYDLQRTHAEAALHCAKNTGNPGFVEAAETDLAVALANNGEYASALALANKLLLSRSDNTFLRELKAAVEASAKRPHPRPGARPLIDYAF